MLVQIALIVFALCGLLSLVVDIGYARLTQGQMQNAADAAALDGLRSLNVSNDAFQSDCFRRAAANRIVRWTFDDDFEPAGGDPEYQFGAGPVIDLTEGVTSVHALQTISVPDPHVYKPDPQLNQQNVVYGDMVSGTFCYLSDPVPSEGGTYELQDLVCEEPQRGSGIYSRNDFNPNLTPPLPSAALSECPAADEPVTTPPAIPGPGTPADVANNSAFLVRLRRSNDFQGLAGQAESTVGSSGPSLPLTFGKGTTIHGDDPSSDYSVRRDGLTVRATAIAAVRPALHLGVPQPSTPTLTPFVLLDMCVQTPPAAQVTMPIVVTVMINPVTGVMTRSAPAVGLCPATTVVGRFVANTATLRTVGQVPPVAAVVTPCASAASFTGRYGAVISQMSVGPNRIIGFARINFTRVATCPANAMTPFAATITRQPSTVAPSNATAILSGGFPAGVPPALVRELLDKNRLRTVPPIDYGSVLVPVLAR